ncbi:kinesin light chain [Penicillium herquei]|nr:kinesin light chain [Penicillium herquei]
MTIVAIHGLDARSPKTWTFIEKNGKSTRSTNWLKDILPNDFDSANVYTYDWQAEFMGNSLQDSLRDHAKRFLSLILPPGALAPLTSTDEWVPIIFIASCFGGLLLAEIIPPENSRFIGRAKFVEKIFVSIRDKPSGDKDAVRTIFGLEGVGKTEVALKIAHRFCQQKDNYENRSWSVFWVSANTPESLHEDYRTIARSLDSNLDADTLSNNDLRRLVNQILKGKTKNWLFVFDDAREWLRREDLPHALLGSVLITTDDRRVADSLGSRSDLELLEEKDAIDLFEQPFNSNRQSKDIIDIDIDKKDIKKLVGTCLMFHPLAIKLASDYIARQGRRHGIKEYVDNWALSRASAIEGSRSIEINNWSIEIIVKQVFKTSLDQVISEDRSTLPILGMIASFDKTNIPLLLLRGVHDENGRLVDLDKVLDILISYSFIAWHQESEPEGNITKPASIDVHELVQRAMEDRFKAQGIYSQQLIADVISVAEQVGMPSPQDEKRKLRLIVPHVESVLRKAEKACQNPGNHASLSQIFIYGGPGWHLYYVVGQMHLLLGEQQKAERHHQKALHLELRDVADTFFKVSTKQAKLFGVEPKTQDPKTSKTGEMGPKEILSTISEKLSLASALVNKGSCQAAQDLFQEASDKSQAKLGITHPLTISALSHLGQTQSLRGDLKAAAATFEKVLDFQKAALPRDCEGPLRIYQAIFSTLETLTFVYQSDGDYQMVQERLDQARKVQIDYIRDDHAIQWCEEYLKLMAEQQRPLSPVN